MAEHAPENLFHGFARTIAPGDLRRRHDYPKGSSHGKCIALPIVVNGAREH
jgi:hypothetical protein